ncbi:MAG: 23S rRNA (uracil(1939)-C(5))-methyltransferase RlmD [Chlamydiia bacterium]
MMECVIDRLNDKGHGRGHLPDNKGGVVVDVKGAFIGETVTVELKKGRRGVKKGILQQIEVASVDRVPDLCSHAAICGGCNLHGLNYTSQVAIKQQITQKLFSHPVNPILAAPCATYYRNKMEFSFSEDKEKRRYLGLVMEDSRGKVFNQKNCALCPEWMLDTLTSIYDHWCKTSIEAYYLHTNSGSLRTLTCRSAFNTSDRMVILGLSGNPQFALSYEELLGFKEAILRANADCSNLSIFVVLTHIEKGTPTYTSEIHLHGKDHYEEHLLGKRFLISPQAFFQPNPNQTAILYQTAFDLLDPKSTDRVLDLYCGVGSIGICLKDKVASVFGVELNRYAVCDAKRNIEINHLENVDVAVGDVKEVLHHHKSEPFSIVIVDPPRAGLDEQVVETLTAMAVEKLLYISCNPKTLSRDLILLEAKGYEVQVLQPVDQFPQTLHLEMIAILKFVG